MQAFHIHKTTIEAGQNEIVKLPIGSLPSGNRIYVQVHVYRSKKPGPTMLLLAGMHGDEINGVEILRRAIAQKYFENLERGSVIVVPLLNVYGFINFSREVPDGKDVNRSFPGNTSGSLASRVARSITKKVLPYVDFGVDFHTGGHNNYNYPQIRFSVGSQESEELAKVFATPILLEKATIAKSFRKVALEAEIPIIVYEGGENLRYDGISIEHGLAGIKRLLHYKGMIIEKIEGNNYVLYTKSRWVRASKAGLFLWSKCSGHEVNEGEPIGQIHDPYGKEEHTILSPRDGFIIGHNNAPVVNAGDALFHIAYEKREK